MKWILPALTVLLCWTSCNNSGGSAPILTPQQEIAAKVDSFKAKCSPGDLITHLNDDVVSYVISNMNEKDKSFSHSGVVVIRNGQKMVCNIYPSLEPNSVNDTIQYEPLDSFLNPDHNLTAGLFRYDLSAAEKTAFLQELDNWKAQNPHFDELYKYETDDKLYCSEMIAKSLSKVTNDRYSFKKIVLTPALSKLFIKYYSKKHNFTEEIIKNTPYVPIDNLYNIPQCTEVMRVKLKYVPGN